MTFALSSHSLTDAYYILLANLRPPVCLEAIGSHTLAWHIFHRKPCEIEAWKVRWPDNMFWQWVSTTRTRYLCGRHLLTLIKSNLSPFIKVQCGISCDSENIRRAVCWSKQKKSLRGFSGGIYSITGAPGECPRRILYAAIQLKLRQIKELNGPKLCDNSHRSSPHMNSIDSHWQIPQHPIEHLEEQFC